MSNINSIRPPIVSPLSEKPLDQLCAWYRQHLINRAYAPLTIEDYLGVLTHFANWLKPQGIDIAVANADHVGIFLNDHLPGCRCPTPSHRRRNAVRPALNQFLRMLGRPTRPRFWPPAIVEVVAAYDIYLDALSGLARSTRLYRQRYAGEFLLHHFPTGLLHYPHLTPARVRAYATKRSRELAPASAGVMCVSLRNFLRFLQVNGDCGANLAAAVPSVPIWGRSGITSMWKTGMVQRLLASFDCATASGKRDYAMCRCLVDLGLRTSDVAHLCLEDLNWHCGILRVRIGKSRRVNQLPLPSSTGKAIADYLQNGRPMTVSCGLFVHHRRLSGAPIASSTVRAAMRRGFARAGISPALSQVHRLRHSAATRLLEAGVSFKTIADILDHRSYDTTGQYLTIDKRRLLDVAMPWPGRTL